jgi:hypothetical protein
MVVIACVYVYMRVYWFTCQREWQDEDSVLQLLDLVNVKPTSYRMFSLLIKHLMQSIYDCVRGSSTVHEVEQPLLTHWLV